MLNKIKYFGVLMILFVLTDNNIKAQTSEELINLLIQKQVIKQEEADSIRAEVAFKGQQEKEKQRNFFVNASKQIQIYGYTQVRFQSLQEAGKIDGIDLRRVRLDFKGIISEDWDYRLQTDFASTPKIIDAFLGYTYEDYLKITAGQLKIPFSQENLISDERSESIDRSQVVEALVARGKDVIGNHNGRDIGLQLSGNLLSLTDRYLFDYTVGVFDGAGINAADNNEAKDFAGRLIFHPISGLDLGGSYYNGYDAWKVKTKDINGNDIEVLKNQARVRYGAELKFKYESLSLTSEYITGKDAIIKRDGWYAQLTYFLFPKKLQVLAKLDNYDPDKDKANNKSTNYSAGINFYFNEWAKLQTQYVLRKEENTQINNDTVAFQLQLGF